MLSTHGIQYSVEDYLNAVTANLILNIGPEPVNTPLHPNLIYRRTALIQTTHDDQHGEFYAKKQTTYAKKPTNV